MSCTCAMSLRPACPRRDTEDDVRARVGPPVDSRPQRTVDALCASPAAEPPTCWTDAVSPGVR